MSKSFSSSSSQNKCTGAIKREISAESISKTLDEFGSGPPYEFQTRATRRRSGDNMYDPLNAKLGQCDNTSDKTDVHNEVQYVPAISKEILESEWDRMFGPKDYKQKLRSLALGGKLRDFPRFRGVCWRVFLECLPDDVNSWMKSISESRTKYQFLKSKHLVDPYSSTTPVKEDVHVFNPLSQHDDSPWTQYFKDKKLNDVILQDLERLFPGMHYFQSKRIKDILLNILFCYARKNPGVGYKQGMHEILAPLLFVLEYDSEVYPYLIDCDNELMKELVDPQYLEYDAFALFDHLMDIIEPWYAQTESPTVALRQSFDAMGFPFMESQPTTPPTAIVRKLNKIQESMLKKYDRVLYNHLRDFEIAPQLFGLRWVRLLFGREFTTIEDIFTLWDGLFADGISLDLVDYIYLSLLCHRRAKLLSSDHSECLTTLMKTPFSKRGAKTVIIEAKQLRDAKLDPAALRKPKYYEPTGPQRPPVKTEVTEPFQARITGGLQSVLRSNRQTPVKRNPSETRTTHQSRKPDLNRQPPAEERKQNIESKSTKSVPPFHLFPHDPDDEDLFATSPRTRSSSGNFLSKLSSKVRSKTDLTTLQQDHERLQVQVSQFKTEIDKLQSISMYCGKKMDSYISILQEEVNNDDKSMDVLYLSIAGLKQVRDLLKGTLTFQPSTVEQDSEFSHIDSVITSLRSTGHENQKNNSLPEAMPVPFLADFGHFKRQDDEYILVEPDEPDVSNEGDHTQTIVEKTNKQTKELQTNNGEKCSSDPLNTEYNNDMRK